MLKHYDPKTGKYTDAEKTLRDEFAMAALTGMINYMANMKVKAGGLGYEVTINMPEVAIASYEYADAMMSAREGKTNGE